MPNHVANRLTVSGTKAEMQKFFDTFKDEKDERGDSVRFSFEWTVPMPAKAKEWDGSTRSKPELNWYDWSCENWGTKWDCYSVKPVVRQPSKIDIWFDTAWAAPTPWLERVSKLFKGLKFTLRYSDNGMPYYGEAVAVDGQVKEKHVPYGEGYATKKHGDFRKAHKLHAYG